MGDAPDPRDATATKRASRLPVLGAVAGLCAYEAILILRPWDEFGTAGLRHAAVSALAAVTAVACARRGQREHGRTQLAWRVLSASSALVAVSLLISSYEVLVHHDPMLGRSDASRQLFMAAVPFSWAGLLLLAGRSRLTSRALIALDALIIAGACLFVGWMGFLGRLYHSSVLPRPERLAATVFGLSIVVNVALVLIVAVRWEGNRRTLGLLALGYASPVYLLVYFLRGGQVAGPYDFGLFLGYLFLALAAADRPSGPMGEPADLRRQWRLALGLPYVCAIVVAGTVAVLVLTGRSFDVFGAWLGTAIGVVVLTRLLLTLLENRSITLDLEARIEDRTQELRRSQERFRSLVQNSSDVIAVVNGVGLVTYASPAVKAMLSYADEELRGSPFLALVHPSDRDQARRGLQSLAAGQAYGGMVSARLRRPDGSWCQVEAMLSVLEEEHARSTVLNIRDVTERVALEQQLRHQALHDVLTTLANRRLFSERVRHARERAQRTGEDLAVLFIDLDNFKRLNDSAGHGAGDELLVAVADRLRECLRTADTCARLGGDEFAVLLEGTGLDEAEVVAQRIVTSLAAPHRTAERDIVLSASVGVASCRGGGLDYDTLLRNADLAMYQAKATGRGRYVVFDPDMHARLLRQVELEAGLRQAIAQRGLQLYYQPIIDLVTGQMTGVEALTRWTRPEQGAVPPTLFIPLAEESDLILSLDRWVLDEACTQVHTWQQRYPDHAGLTANVNFSALELRDSSYRDAVAGALTKSGLAARDVTLEVTETAVMPQQATCLDQLSALRDLGVRISLDDFGTGYSSLATLRELPLDEIKIDASFVEGLQDEPRGRGIVRAIIELAEALQVQTVAEGIESVDQLTALRTLHCHNGQGYLFAPPMPPESLEYALQNGLSAPQEHLPQAAV